MKKLLLVMMVSMVAFLSSCQEEAPVVAEVGNFTMNLTLDPNASGANTRATVASTAKPTTQWSDVKDLFVLLVQGGIVKDAREFNLTTLPSAIATPLSEVFTQVVAGTYDVYVIANANESGAGWTAATLKNKAVADVKLSLAAYSGAYSTTNWADVEGYAPSKDIFWQASAGYVIPSATPLAVTLSRLNSLFRVRLKLGGVNTPADFKFTGSTATNKPFIMVRNINHDYTGLITATPTASKTAVAGAIVYKSVIKDEAYANAASTAISSTYDNYATLFNDGFTDFADVSIYPSGVTTNAQGDMINFVVMAEAVAGVQTGDGNTMAGDLVYWTGTVMKTDLTGYDVVKNNILEVALALNNAPHGIVDPTDPNDPVVPPSTFGNLQVDATIAPWGTIAIVDMEL